MSEAKLVLRKDVQIFKDISCRVKAFVARKGAEVKREKGRGSSSFKVNISGGEGWMREDDFNRYVRRVPSKDETRAYRPWRIGKGQSRGYRF